MKTPEELNALKNEVETLNKKLAELTEEELTWVVGETGDSLPDELPMEKLEQVTGGGEPIGQNQKTGLKGFRIHGIEWNG